MAGTLYIVATPVGNREDMSHRAIRILSSVDTILAEDTRTSAKLLAHWSIGTRCLAYHDFNKEKITPRIINRLRENTDIALISDAGTPGIADPAFYLVREARKNDIPVSPVPGPCAAIAALVASGLPTDRFIFENFLPVKRGKRKKILASFLQEPRTVIFYESPHRICSVLSDMHEVLGDCSVVVARELTKLHEEILPGTPKSLCTHFTAHKPRGEMVVLFSTRIPGHE